MPQPGLSSRDARFFVVQEPDFFDVHGAVVGVHHQGLSFGSDVVAEPRNGDRLVGCQVDAFAAVEGFAAGATEVYVGVIAARFTRKLGFDFVDLGFFDALGPLGVDPAVFAVADGGVDVKLLDLFGQCEGSRSQEKDEAGCEKGFKWEVHNGFRFCVMAFFRLLSGCCQAVYSSCLY